MIRNGILSLLTAGALFAATPAAAQCVFGNVLFENDLGGNTDRHYTHGSRVSCLSAPKGPEHSGRRVAEALQFDLFGERILDTGGEMRYSFALGQSMFTPEDLSRTDVILDDRPYAGWLFGTAGVILGPGEPGEAGSSGFRRLETLQLTLGMVGPASFADETQKFVHSTLDSPHPMGWHNQLQNEPGINLAYERKWRTEAVDLLPGTDLEYDLMPSVGAALGNVHTYASVGATFRFGSSLANDFGPPLLRPSVAGSEYYNPERDETLSGYLFLSFGGRLVGRNIFLDGNTFKDSHSVDKKYLVGDVQFGAVISVYGAARIALTHIVRSTEFRQQDGPNQFSALSVSFQL